MRHPLSDIYLNWNRSVEEFRTTKSVMNSIIRLTRDIHVSLANVYGVETCIFVMHFVMGKCNSDHGSLMGKYITPNKPFWYLVSGTFNWYHKWFAIIFSNGQYSRLSNSGNCSTYRSKDWLFVVAAHRLLPSHKCSVEMSPDWFPVINATCGMRRWW